jgi:hypothetical protein
MEFYPTAFQAAIRILSEHANGASSTYHAQLDTAYRHPVRDQAFGPVTMGSIESR